MTILDRHLYRRGHHSLPLVFFQGSGGCAVFGVDPNVFYARSPFQNDKQQLAKKKITLYQECAKQNVHQVVTAGEKQAVKGKEYQVKFWEYHLWKMEA